MTIYLGIASLLIVILAILIVKNYFEKGSSQVKVQTEDKPESKPPEWDTKTKDKYRIALQKNYNSISNSQAVRLLGLIAVLFTFIQVTPTVTQDISVADPLKILGFVLVSSVLIFFSFRAFFRFSLFSMLSAHIMWINDKEIDYMLEDEADQRGQNTMALLHAATTFKICGELRKNEKDKYKARKIYHLFSYKNFIASDNWRKDLWGYGICLALTSVSILILMVMLW